VKPDEILWDIRPHQGCGPLKFGMKRSDVASLLGKSDSAERTFSSGVDELRSNCPWRECLYEGNQLKRISTNFSQLGNLYLGNVNLMDGSVLAAIELLGQHNGGISQAQGGSLYFDEIGAAFKQFDDPEISEIWLYSSDFDHEEPLRELSLMEVWDYYANGVGGDLGKVPIRP
jgi:hypothetical protein